MRLIIVQTALCDANQDTVAQPGQVVASEAGQLLVATGAGILSLQEIQPAGRRALQVDAFLRGYAVAPGDRFGD